MKNNLCSKNKIIGFFVFTIILGCLYIYFVEYRQRKYYCNLDEGICYTVWDVLNSPNVYIIPGNYKGLFKPTTDYIYTDRRNVFTIFYGDKTKVTLAWRNGHYIDVHLRNYKIEIYNLDNIKDEQNYSAKYLDSNHYILPQYKYFEVDFNR